MTAVEIGGPAWLVNGPSFEQAVIGEDGYPLRMVTPDPRAWAVHKLRLSGRDDRDPAKKNRDRARGALAVELLRTRRPDLPFDDETLSALPRAVRALIDQAAEPGPGAGDDQSGDRLRPNRQRRHSFASVRPQPRQSGVRMAYAALGAQKQDLIFNELIKISGGQRPMKMRTMK